MEKGKFINFESSFKAEKNSYIDNFCDQEEKETYISKKFGGLLALILKTVVWSECV